MVRFENVGMRYGGGPEVLRDVTFSLAAGSFHFVTGPSGAGKTSLLRLMFLGHRPSRGTIETFGEDALGAGRARRALLRRKIGVVFQDFRLIDHLTARDNAALPLRIAGAPPEETMSTVEEMLAWVGLERRMDRTPPMLSGGEKQRLAIARAVVCRPRLLLADEPTGSMDADNARRVMRLFDALNGLGTTVAVATHDDRLLDDTDRPRLELDDGRLTVRGGEPAPAPPAEDDRPAAEEEAGPPADPPADADGDGDTDA